MEKSKVLAALSALANDTRLDLVRDLIAEGPEGLAAGEIGRRLGVTASRLSFHLNTLEQAGLIRSQRVARNVIYAVEPRAVGGMLGYLLHDCCHAHPEVSACCANHVPGATAPDS